jgi:hypothetical protein
VIAVQLYPTIRPHLGEAGLRKMMSQYFRLGRSSTGGLVAQGFADAAVQHQAPALEQILISSVLNERVLEAIVRIWWQTLHQEDVGIGEPV